MKLRLVENGVFPIIKKQSGELIEELPNTGFPISGTFQGEGKLMGIPVLFVRLSGCNLRCMWRVNDDIISICDTPYASFSDEKNELWEAEDIFKTIQLNRGNINHIVISGGEPSIQEDALLSLVQLLKKEEFHITIETNGVYFPEKIARYIDLFSISPKLSSSVPDNEKLSQLSLELADEQIQFHRNSRINIDVIQRYINHCYHSTSYYGDFPNAEVRRKSDPDFQLKFVVSSPNEVEEIRKDFLDKLKNVEAQDVLLMPVGKDARELQISSRFTAQMAIENGWRFAPRIHIDVFGNVSGT